jgi:hypothetical protein
VTRIAAPTDPLRWTEGQLQTEVIATARASGWGLTISKAKEQADELAAYGLPPLPLEGLVFHPRYSLGSEPGWPDLTLIRRRDRRLIFAELKSEKGQLSPRQAEVLDLLRLFATPVPALCGSGPHGRERPEPRLACCPPWIQVVVWRPRDLAEIGEVLR